MNRHRTKIPKQNKQNYRFLIPDKVLFQKISKPEIRALSLLNEILQVSKVCTVNKGIISADYDGLICASFLHHYLGWTLVGYYNMENIWISQKGLDNKKELIWVDLNILPKQGK